MSLSQTIQPFLDSLAEGTAAPGGGGAAAASGAMGAALVSMVCNLTIGRKRYADVDVEMRNVLSRAEALRSELTKLVDEDAAAYLSVMDAYRLPKATDEEQAARQIAIQRATTRATQTPLTTTRACAEVIKLCQVVVEIGNPNAKSDAAAGAACALAGLKAASLNVLVNLASLEDERFVDESNAEVEALLAWEAQVDHLFASMK